MGVGKCLEIVLEMLNRIRITHDQGHIGLVVEGILRKIGRTGPDFLCNSVYQADDYLVVADIDSGPFDPDVFQAKMVDHLFVLCG
jgi:hypothetical protein